MELFLLQGSKCKSGSEIYFDHVFVNLYLNWYQTPTHHLDLSKFGNEDVSEKARVIQQEIDEAVEAELSKIASKEFDGLRTYAVPPKSTVQPSRSLFEELQPINTEKYQPVTNLQPIANLSMEDDEEDSSPPTDSLKSIKSIAEERKKKLRNKSQDLHTKMKSDTDITKKTSRAKAQRGNRNVHDVSVAALIHFIPLVSF